VTELSDERNEPAEHQIARQTLTQTVMYVTDWTTETVISQIVKGNILLNPRFQRRDAWTKIRKSQFVESILLGLPIPQIVLAESLDDPGRFVVLDGKQRLITLMQFVGEGGESDNNKFSLRGLEVLDHLNGLTFDQFSNDPALATYLRQFSNYSVRSSIVRNWGDPALLDTIFVRLNSNSVQLSPQELRQALNPGPFSDFIDDSSANSLGLKSLLGIKKPDFRMRDAEILLRLLAFSFNVGQYSGNMRAFLDDFASHSNANWGAIEQDVRRRLVEIEAAIECGLDLMGDAFGRRSAKGTFQQVRNRAVLDVQVFFLEIPAVRHSLAGRGAEVISAFHEVSSNEEFTKAVEATTKSIDAVFTRFQMWAEALGRLGANVPAVQLRNGRLAI
jgi:hypothetical protein